MSSCTKYRCNQFSSLAIATQIASMSDIPPHRITRTHLLKNFGRAENAKPPALSLAVLKAHLARQSYKKQKVAPKPLKRISANKALVSSTVPSATVPVTLTVVAPMLVQIAPNEPAFIEIDMSATSPATSALIESNLDPSTSSAEPPKAPSPTSEISPALQPSESLPTCSINSVSAHDSDTLGVRVISRLMLVNDLSAHSVESLARIRVYSPGSFWCHVTRPHFHTRLARCIPFELLQTDVASRAAQAQNTSHQFSHILQSIKSMLVSQASTNVNPLAQRHEIARILLELSGIMRAELVDET